MKTTGRNKLQNQMRIVINKNRKGYCVEVHNDAAMYPVSFSNRGAQPAALLACHLHYTLHMAEQPHSVCTPVTEVAEYLKRYEIPFTQEPTQ